MKPTVVVTNRVQDAVIDRLARHFTVVANREPEPWPDKLLRDHLARADAMIAFMTDRIDDAVLEQSPRLKLVSCCLKGFDNFDIEACSRRDVLVTILPDLLTEPGAELAIGLMIAAGRHLLAADGYVRRGEFNGWRPRFYGTGLAESTIGIIGFGAVGQAIADRLRAFRCAIRYWDKRRLDKEAETRVGASYHDLDRLLAASDFIVVAVALTRETRHLINAERLSRVKQGAILVNFARGSVVDEAAVAEALKKGPLGFYAADAFEFEDWALSDRPGRIDPSLLTQTDRTLFTPHLGSAVRRVREEMALQAADNVIAFFSGRIPEGAVNADVVLAVREGRRC